MSPQHVLLSRDNDGWVLSYYVKVRVQAFVLSTDLMIQEKADLYWTADARTVTPQRRKEYALSKSAKQSLNLPPKS